MAVKSSKRMPSQFPALRLTVARQMEGYQERVAQKIRSEARKRGESPVDLAAVMGTHPSTTERWFRGERMPQRRYRKELAEHWELTPDFFEPDLEAEEKEVRDQLDRMEKKLDELLAALGATAPPAEEVDQPTDPEAEEADRETDESSEDDDEAEGASG